MRIIILSLFFITGIKATAQPETRLPGTSNPVEDSLVSIYYTHQMKGPAFLNGRVYNGYAPSIQGHAFFQTRDWTRGSVLYDGLWYRNENLVYDIYNDQLILRHPLGFAMILIRERVKEFRIGEDIFIHLGPGEGKIQHGFYQRLTTGRATFYIKRIKILEEKIEGLQLERKFIQMDKYFIKKDEVFHPVSRQKDLMRALSDKTQALSRYKTEKKPKFKYDPERFILLVTDHYNKL